MCVGGAGGSCLEFDGVGGGWGETLAVLIPWFDGFFGVAADNGGQIIIRFLMLLAALSSINFFLGCKPSPMRSLSLLWSFLRTPDDLYVNLQGGLFPSVSGARLKSLMSATW